MITNNFTNSGIIILILRSTFSAFLLLVNNSKHYYNVSAFSSSTKYCRFDIVTDSTGKTLIAEEDNANDKCSISSSRNNNNNMIVRRGGTRLNSLTINTENDESKTFSSDPARTTPEFLAGLWRLIAKGNTMVRGVSNIHRDDFQKINGLTSIFHKSSVLFFSSIYKILNMFFSFCSFFQFESYGIVIINYVTTRNRKLSCFRTCKRN